MSCFFDRSCCFNGQYFLNTIENQASNSQIDPVRLLIYNSIVFIVIGQTQMTKQNFWSRKAMKSFGTPTTSSPTQQQGHCHSVQSESYAVPMNNGICATDLPVLPDSIDHLDSFPAGLARPLDPPPPCHEKVPLPKTTALSKPQDLLLATPPCLRFPEPVTFPPRRGAFEPATMESPVFRQRC